MKKQLFVCYLFFLFPFLGFSQDVTENETGNFVNSIYYYNRLDYLRNSFDRWQCIMKDHAPGEDIREYNFGIYSALNDFNLGRNVDGERVFPMLLGYALGTKNENLGFYFLLNSTDVSKMRQKNDFGQQKTYEAISLGLNYQSKYVSALADLTLANNTLSYYGKVFIPLIRTHFGVSSSPYNEIVNSTTGEKKIVKSKIGPNQFVIGSSLFSKFNLGMKIFTLTKVKYMPNISTAAHNFIDESEWGSVKYDAEFFFETRGEEWANFFNMKDFDARFVLYRFIGDLGFEASEGEDVGIAVRWAVFLGLSYKSTTNYFTETLTESGLTYNGQSGLGFDIGTGLRVLGFKKYGFQEDTYVRFSYFYNYSQYFEHYPGVKSGLKFKVVF